MKKHFLSICLLIVSVFISFNAYAGDTDNKITRVSLQDNKQALVNPMMGWTMHFYSNIIANYGSKLEPCDVLDYFPGMSTVYLRIPWSFLEPEEGKIRWEILDTPAQRWIQAGKKVAFRITSTENWTHQGTPQWVFDAGAKYYEVGNYIEPEYDDPVFLEKLENFLSKMAERYDNNPNVDFIDIGHFGMWGEGHTVMTSPKHGHTWGLETKKKYIDLYCKYFKNVQLCISDDIEGPHAPGPHYPVMEYALSKGVTMRDDSILVGRAPRNWFHSDMAQIFWQIMPVILEHEHYGNAIRNKSWDKDLLLQSVEDYHASYMSIHWWPDIHYAKNKDVIEKINMRLGYRIQVPVVEWPSCVKKDEPFTILSEWKNVGVAPCYPGGYPCFTIKDEKDGVVAVLVEDVFNVKNLPVDKPGLVTSKKISSEFVIAPKYGLNKQFARTCKPGKYTIYISVGRMDGTPQLELPYENSDSHKRYKLGEFTIVE